MPKIMVEGKISVDDILDGSLQTIYDRVKMLLDKFGTSAVIIQDAGYNNICSELVFEREETDLEYAQRLDAEQKTAETAKRKKEKELAKLKKMARELGYTLSPRI